MLKRRPIAGMSSTLTRLFSAGKRGERPAAFIGGVDWSVYGMVSEIFSHCAILTRRQPFSVAMIDRAEARGEIHSQGGAYVAVRCQGDRSAGDPSVRNASLHPLKCPASTLFDSLATLVESSVCSPRAASSETSNQEKQPARSRYDDGEYQQHGV